MVAVAKHKFNEKSVTRNFRKYSSIKPWMY